MAAKRHKSVSISIHTIDKGELPLADNIQLLEIDIDLFNDMSRQDYIRQVLDTAEKFWQQMQRGKLRSKSKIKFKRKISADNIGNV